MAWFASLLVAVFMLGSILWLRPGAGDRRRMALRQRALELGMAVSLQRLELPGQEARSMAVYLKRRQDRPERDAEMDYWHLVRSDSAFFAPSDWAGWGWQRRPRRVPTALESLLNGLPAGILAVAMTGEGVQFWWQEDSDDCSLVDLLAETADQLLSS